MHTIWLSSVVLILLLPAVSAEQQQNLLWRYEIGGEVRGVAISPEGDHFVAGAANGYVYRLNESGNLSWKYLVKSPVLSVDISSKGKYVAVADESGIYLLDENETLLWEYYVGDYVRGVAISSDGGYVAAGSSNGNVYLLDRNKNLLWKHDIKSPVQGIAISSDGGSVVAGSSDGYVRMLDVNENLLWEYETKHFVSNVGVSPQGDYVVAASYPFLYILHGDGKEFKLRSISADALGASISSGGAFILAGYEDSKVSLFDKDGKAWDYETGGIVFSVDISPEGDRMIAGSGDGFVYAFSKPEITPLSVKITSPTETTVSGIVTIDASVDGPVSETMVKIDGDDVSTSLPVTMIATPEGKHTISVTVIDASGNSKTDEITVIVQGAGSSSQSSEDNMTTEIKDVVKEIEGKSDNLSLNQTVRPSPGTLSVLKYTGAGALFGLILGIFIGFKLFRKKQAEELEREKYEWKPKSRWRF